MRQTAIGAPKLRKSGIRCVQRPRRRLFARAGDRIIRNSVHNTNPMHHRLAFWAIAIWQYEDEAVLPVSRIPADLADTSLAEQIRGFREKRAFLCHSVRRLRSEQLNINGFTLPLLTSPA